MTGDRKNSFEPEPAMDCRDRVRQHYVALARPIYHANPHIGQPQPGVQVPYHRIQAEQAGAHSPHRVPAPAASRLQAEVGTHFLKCGFDVPSTRTGLEHQPGTNGRIGGDEVLIMVSFGQVADEDPSHRNQRSTVLVPVTCPGNDLYSAATSIPSDFQAVTLHRACDYLLRDGESLPLDSRTPLAGVIWRRGHRVGIGVQLADERQSPGIMDRQLSQVIDGVVAVGGADKPSIWESTDQHQEHLAQQFRPCFVPSSLPVVLFLQLIQGHKQGQSSPASGEQEADQQRQHDPLVSPAECRERVSGADRVAMMALPIDLAPGMLRNGIIARQFDNVVGRESSEDHANESPRQMPAALRTAREETVIAGRGSGG